MSLCSLQQHQNSSTIYSHGKRQDIAKKVIEDDLADTQFADYIRIYDEGAD